MKIMRDCLLEKFLIMIAVGCVLVVHACSSAERTSDQLTEEIDNLLLQQTETGQFSGAVFIAKGGEVLLEKGYGFADRIQKIPNTPKTQFQLASVSKLITRVSVLLENERGALNTGQCLSDFFPEYPDGDRIKLSYLINCIIGNECTIEMPEVNSSQNENSWLKGFMNIFKEK